MSSVLNCSKQILKCHGGYKVADAQNVSISMSVRLSYAQNPAGCALTRNKLISNSKELTLSFFFCFLVLLLSA